MLLLRSTGHLVLPKGHTPVQSVVASQQHGNPGNKQRLTQSTGITEWTRLAFEKGPIRLLMETIDRIRREVSLSIKHQIYGGFINSKRRCTLACSDTLLSQSSLPRRHFRLMTTRLPLGRRTDENLLKSHAPKILYHSCATGCVYGLESTDHFVPLPATDIFRRLVIRSGLPSGKYLNSTLLSRYGYLSLVSPSHQVARDRVLLSSKARTATSTQLVRQRHSDLNSCVLLLLSLLNLGTLSNTIKISR